MKNANRVLIFVLIFALIVSMFSGCKQTAPSPEQTTTEQKTTEQKTTEQKTTEQKTTEQKTTTAAEPGREKLSAADGTEYYAAGYPIVDPEQNISYSVMASTSASDATKFPVMQKIVSETGINFDWILIASDARQERLSAAVAADDLPDILGPSVGFGDAELLKYGNEGYIADISDLWNNKMTTIRSMTGDEVFNQLTNEITFPNGAIYNFPTIMDYDTVSEFHLAINVEWLDKLGLQMPTTPDEFVEVLKTFVTNDPNSNGKNDEIGYVSQAWAGIANLYEITGFTGVLTGTRYIQDGEVKWPLFSDEVKEATKWLKMLYDENLLDKEQFTQDDPTAMAKAQSPDSIYGAANMFQEKYYFGNNCLEYFPMEAFAGADGKRMWPTNHPHGYLVMNQMTLTTKCTSPEIVARLVDYMYLPLISAEIDQGPIGITQEFNENGYLISVTPEGYENVTAYTRENHFQQLPRFLFSKYLNEKTFQRFLEVPTSIPESKRMIDGLDGRTYANIMAEDYLYYYPRLKPTEEEAAVLNEYMTDLSKYYQESLAKFITGASDIDTEWDTYVETVKAFGYEEIMTMYNAQYQRFLSLGN
ncbi:MAG: extracellular solute-binding protein [Clostridiales bacterium]|nr:extracellular solute-binding protein [Clostridiales bacterium]